MRMSRNIVGVLRGREMGRMAHAREEKAHGSGNTMFAEEPDSKVKAGSIAEVLSIAMFSSMSIHADSVGD